MDQAILESEKNLLNQEMDLLREFVDFNTQSKNIKGVEHFQIKLSEKFEEMGFLTHLILNPHGVSAPLLVAEKLGKSYNMVNAYAQNRQQPRLEDLYKIAEILNVEVKDLLIERTKLD